MLGKDRIRAGDRAKKFLVNVLEKTYNLPVEADYGIERNQEVHDALMERRFNIDAIRERHRPDIKTVVSGKPLPIEVKNPRRTNKYKNYTAEWECIISCTGHTLLIFVEKIFISKYEYILDKKFIFGVWRKDLPPIEKVFIPPRIEKYTNGKTLSENWDLLIRKTHPNVYVLHTRKTNGGSDTPYIYVSKQLCKPLAIFLQKDTLFRGITCQPTQQKHYVQQRLF